MALSVSCASILETDNLTIVPHAELDPPELDDEVPEAANYSELRAAVYDLLNRGQIAGTINVFEYDGDLDAELDAVREDILYRDCVGSYALSDILSTVTPIVSYYEIRVDMTYRRTREQIDGIVTASTQRYLRAELLEMMGDYRADAAIRTSLPGITEREILGYLSEIYYENPLLIVMLPITTASVYPPGPTDSDEILIELNFGYSQPNSVLRRFSGWLQSAVGDIAEAASGENDGEILLSLCRALAELAEYDAAAASLSEYPTQSFSATAYGALLNGSAIGEGYAMAYKALCDELSIPCRVVLGSRDGLPYAWNIVLYDGEYYHVDPALCDELGMETGFLKNDADMEEHYLWERGAYPVCDGEATYYDITGERPPVEPDPEPEPEPEPEPDDGGDDTDDTIDTEEN
jgi:hypothetical protein